VSTIVNIGTAPGLLSLVVNFCRQRGLQYGAECFCRPRPSAQELTAAAKELIQTNITALPQYEIVHLHKEIQRKTMHFCSSVPTNLITNALLTHHT